MKALNNVDLEEVLVIDIETVRVVQFIEEGSEELISAWEHKNKQDGQIPHEDKLSDLWIEKASLYPEFSKVCAISLLYMKVLETNLEGEDKIEVRCKSYSGPDERLILEAFSSDLHKLKRRRDRLAGHASKYFDYPFLAKRYMMADMEIPGMLDSSLLKPWEGKNLDTNELYKSFGTGPGSSLQALCMAFKVPISKVDLVGDEVGAAYYRGEFDRIAKYCDLDAIATFNILRRFKRESIVQFDEVVYAKEDFKGGDDKPASNKPVAKKTTKKKVTPKKEVVVEKEIAEKSVEVVEGSIVETIKETGKFGKREANKIIKVYGKTDEKTKQEVVNSLQSVLISAGNTKTQLKKNKIFLFLKEQLNIK